MKYFLIITSIIVILFGWFILEMSKIGGGTLGGFPSYKFQVKSQTLESAFDRLLEKDSSLHIPQKWQDLDDWTERGYDFLETRIIYFKDEPEEMYYISFLGDSLKRATSSTSEVAIRAVANSEGWNLKSEFSNSEINRIQNRFNNQIISKINMLIKAQSINKETKTHTVSYENFKINKYNFCLPLSLEITFKNNIFDSLPNISFDSTIIASQFKRTGFKQIDSGWGNWQNGPRFLFNKFEKDSCNCQTFRKYKSYKQQPNGLHTLIVSERIICNTDMYMDE